MLHNLVETMDGRRIMVAWANEWEWMPSMEGLGTVIQRGMEWIF